jgi:ABC-2 type transport system ATP-binding protein
LAVSALSAPDIGDLAGTNGIFLHELAAQSASLEEAFMEMTRESVEFHAEAFQPHEPVAAASAAPSEES